jgi:hypothetical protein
MSQNEFDVSQFPKTGQRLTISDHQYDINNQENPAIILDPDSPTDAEELAKDELGFTNPNLHRRIRTNTTQDGKKVYTIAESHVTRHLNAIYKTKYPIANIKFVYISGSSIRLTYEGVKYYWVTSTRYTVGDSSFRFESGYEPYGNLPMEVIYETIPLIDDEVTYRDYELAISGTNSYRTTKITLHTEEDEGDRDHRVYENEIP